MKHLKSVKTHIAKFLVFVLIIFSFGCSKDSRIQYSINYHPKPPFKTSNKQTNTLPNQSDITNLLEKDSFEASEIEIQTTAKPAKPNSVIYRTIPKPEETASKISLKKQEKRAEAEIILPIEKKSPTTHLIPAFYTAKKGDTLYSLSKKHDISMSYIIDLNQLESPYELIEGLQYLLPIRSVHMVFPGDTITSIALRYKITIKSLLETNSIASKSLSLIPGEEIKLPRIPLSVVITARNKKLVKLSPRKKASSSKIKKAKSTTPVVKTAKLASVPLITKKDSSIKEQARVALSKIPNSLLPPALKRSKKTFLEPVKGVIIQRFGERVDGIKQEGIRYKVPFRSPVQASENGVVIFSDQSLSALGKLLLIKHTGGFFTAYANIDSLEVTRGDIVKRSQVVAYSGKNSKNNQPQLMFQIRKNRKAVDPEQLLTP